VELIRRGATDAVSDNSVARNCALTTANRFAPWPVLTVLNRVAPWAGI
jgi:hypothetical protein